MIDKIQKLIKEAEQEVIYYQGRLGFNNDSDEIAYSYSFHNLEQLKQTLLYYQGEPPEEGLTWEVINPTLVVQVFDKSISPEEHPFYLRAIKENKATQSQKVEFLKVFKRAHYDKPDINSFFALTYFWKLNDLVPDDIKLLDKIKKV
jgi:hypothetical protein